MKSLSRILSVVLAFSLAGAFLSCGAVPDIHNDPEAMAQFRQTLVEVSDLLIQDAYEEATEPAFQLMEMAPEDPHILTISCLVTGRTGYLEDSLVLAQQAYDLCPNDPILQNNLAYSLARLDRDLDQAYELIQKSIEVLPENSAVLDTMAWVLYKMDRADEALPYIEAAMKGPWTPWEKDLIESHRAEILQAR